MKLSGALVLTLDPDVAIVTIPDDDECEHNVISMVSFAQPLMFLHFSSLYYWFD